MQEGGADIARFSHRKPDMDISCIMQIKPLCSLAAADRSSAVIICHLSTLSHSLTHDRFHKANYVLQTMAVDTTVLKAISESPWLSVH